MGLEINFKTTDWYRIYGFGSYGQASITIQNDFTNVSVAPSANVSLQYKGAAIETCGGLGLEVAAFDTTSMIIAVGYRDLVFSRLTYGLDVASSASFDGAHTAGDPVLMSNGAAREINERGSFVNFGLRFWL